MYDLIIVWKNQEKFYAKRVSGFYKNYYIGYRNSYGHVIVDIIKYPLIKPRLSYRLINRCIRFLEKLKRHIS